MWETIKSGAFATEERLRLYPLLLLAVSVAAVVALAATSHDGLDMFGRPLGTDFSQVYVAGLEALAGRPETPFDLPAHIAEQHKLFGENATYGWHYPPFFLGLAAALAKLPYLAALAIWQATTLLAYLAVIFAILSPTGLSRLRILIAALAFPAVLVNLTHGQNGFLTAALLGAGLLLLERRPLAAGLFFGLLAYKPQFALALPVALLAGGYWTAIAAAVATAAALTLASLWAFGLAAWQAFFASLPVSRRLLVEEGAIGFEKIQSVFAAVRLLGGDAPLAYAAQAAVTLVTLAALAWLWRTGADRRLRAAATIIAALLTTPYCLDYDMAALGPALAFLLAHGLETGFRPFEKSALCLAYVMPVAARQAGGFLRAPIGALTVALLFYVTVQAARSGPPRRTPGLLGRERRD